LTKFNLNLNDHIPAINSVHATMGGGTFFKVGGSTSAR